MTAFVWEILSWLPLLLYFVGLDTLEPFLETRGLEPIWWFCLVLLLLLMFGLTGQLEKAYRDLNPNATRRGSSAKKVDLALLGVTLFLYDPTINPHLSSFGLGWLWLVSLSALFAWLFFDVGRTIKQRRSRAS
jgi:hypothetical protein